MKSKSLIIFGTIVLFVIGSIIFLSLSNRKNILAVKNSRSSSNVNKDSITIMPQSVKDKVTVESATLQKDGFLVVRQMDDGKLSQVIEMSQPLKTGTHTNVTINLGRAEIANKELIVMIYEDYAYDDIFNDLDMPALNENGNMTARFVASGKPLPISITEGESVGMTHTMAGAKTMAKVKYTDKGFVPNKVEVPVGSTVEFINQSSMDMWVASVPHPQHSKLPTFDQFRLYKKGAIYRYVFDKKGTWEYHDHISPTAGGIVTVN